MTKTAIRSGLSRIPLNAMRGFLIGLAELVPGVSGGTVALVTGVYERLIEAASRVFGAVRRLITGPDRIAGFRAELRRTDWWLVGAVLIGMAAALLTVAGAVEEWVTGNPELSRGLFFGMVAVSMVVPFRLLPRIETTGVTLLRDTTAVVVPAAAVFFLLGFGGGGTIADPPMWGVFLAAIVAVCALVVPGVSGSFLLLALGLYAPTLRAVDELDLGYLAVFAAGALVGLVTVVQVMRVLLARRRRITLLVITGLMLGSLRALWPWQADGTEDGAGALVAPFSPIVGPVALALLGAAIVGALIVAEAWFSRRAIVESVSVDGSGGSR